MACGAAFSLRQIIKPRATQVPIRASMETATAALARGTRKGSVALVVDLSPPNNKQTE